MVDASSPSPDTIETKKDLGSGDAATFAYWQAQEAIADKEEKRWRKQGRDIVKRYRDERPEQSTDAHRFNIFWSNVQTLLPTLYGRTPKADVERRWRDNDKLGRYAAIILERTLQYHINDVFDESMKSVVLDHLLPGRGTARVLYIPTYGDKVDYETEEAPANVVDSLGDTEEGQESPEEEEQEINEGSPGDLQAGPQGATQDAEELREVLDECVEFRYIFWEDYMEGPARKWLEVPWIRYRAYLDREELIKRFGKAKGKKVELDYVPKGGSNLSKEDVPPDLYKKATIHEVWDKRTRKVCWYAPGTPDLILDEMDDPLGLKDFYPSPDPLSATMTNDKRQPVADYHEYQDQARELDTLTARIDRLVRAMKVAGLYPGAEKSAIQQLVDEGTENRLIPVEDWAVFMEKMGPNGFIVWLPIQQVGQVLIQLYQARERVKNLLYEITGMSDILRGATSPYETEGAQELKANFAGRRIQPRQAAVARFARDAIRLMAEVICEHFDENTISSISGYPQLLPVPPVPPPPPQPPIALAGTVNPQVQQQQMQMMQAYQQAVQQRQQMVSANQALQKQFSDAVTLLKKDGLKNLRLDIEADSTIAPDEQADKQSRVEFLSEFVPFMQQLVPLAQGNPPVAAMAKELAMFAVRGFRTARVLEQSIEQAFDAIAQMQPAPKPGEEGQSQNTESPGDLAIRNKQLQVESAKDQTDAALKQAEMAQRGTLEREKMQLEREKAAMNTAMEADKLADERAFRAVRGEALESKMARNLT